MQQNVHHAVQLCAAVPWSCDHSMPLRLCSSRVYPLPANAEETAQQARAAAQRAWESGIKRQRIELLLPLIGATDLDDW
jgi:hypothetical protein